jgi:hypothetical protein
MKMYRIFFKQIIANLDHHQTIAELFSAIIVHFKITPIEPGTIGFLGVPNLIRRQRNLLRLRQTFLHGFW